MAVPVSAPSPADPAAVMPPSRRSSLSSSTPIPRPPRSPSPPPASHDAADPADVDVADTVAAAADEDVADDDDAAVFSPDAAYATLTRVLDTHLDIIDVACTAPPPPEDAVAPSLRPIYLQSQYWLWSAEPAAGATVVIDASLVPRPSYPRVRGGVRTDAQEAAAAAAAAASAVTPRQLKAWRREPAAVGMAAMRRLYIQCPAAVAAAAAAVGFDVRRAPLFEAGALVRASDLRAAVRLRRAFADSRSPCPLPSSTRHVDKNAFLDPVRPPAAAAAAGGFATAAGPKAAATATKWPLPLQVPAHRRHGPRARQRENRRRKSRIQRRR
ncbi:hypothetical protein CXG81DRAFT_19404 [Caulochytrium protostelioides]|uniref:Uncharacterized protein n=1 Tax=Caulochytrium protostelioides TaxID=1555241 RepID=A0A4P9X686_9FUNG|nr:hypothetical protein CXG81DRAFT_19404 [Caulochytrium protostelioides]|eukprot:RKP00678.1 hypothetical protein CXG81DRAFT_19404 [Caulochytrium protostelioides]